VPEPASRYDGIRAPLRPSANSSARTAPRRPTRIASIRMGMIAGIGVLILLMIFIVQNAHAVPITFFGAHASVSLAAALLVAAVAGALVTTAAGTARTTRLRHTMRRTSAADHAYAPASDTHRDRNTGPGRTEPRPRP
jgi:uncharacterized integral membrane protein